MVHRFVVLGALLATAVALPTTPEPVVTPAVHKPKESAPKGLFAKAHAFFTVRLATPDRLLKPAVLTLVEHVRCAGVPQAHGQDRKNEDQEQPLD